MARWAVLFAAFVGLAAAGATPKPNVFIWLMDDMGRADNTVDFTGQPSFENGQSIDTPNMRFYTASGVKFNNGYVQPQCTPTRYAVLAGRWPHRGALGAFALPSAGQANPTPAGKFLGNHLQEQGYWTAAYGKWHLGYNNISTLPVARGFDHFIGFLQGEGEHYSHLFQGSYDWFEQKAENPEDLRVIMADNEKYNDQLTCENTFKVIDRLQTGELTKPAFVYIALANPHTPHDEPPSNIFQNQTLINTCAGLYPTRAVVCRIVAWEDTHFAAFMQKLQNTSSVWQNSMVIFSADNGGLPHYEIAKKDFAGTDYPTIPVNHPRLARFGGNGFNWPLRGGKATAFEGGCRTPLAFLGGDNVIPPARRGAVVDHLIHAVDWPATVMEYAGYTKQEIADRGLDGVSHKDAIQGVGTGAPARDELVLNLAVFNPGKTQLYWTSFRKGNYKIVVRDPGTPPHIYDGWYPASGANTGSTTYIPAGAVPTVKDSLTTDNYMLFDVVADPGERTNLIGSGNGNTTLVNKFQELDNILRTKYVPQVLFMPPRPPRTAQATYMGILWPFEMDLPKPGTDKDCPKCDPGFDCPDCPDCDDEDRCPKCGGDDVDDDDDTGNGGGNGGGRPGGVGGDAQFSFNNFAL